MRTIRCIVQIISMFLLSVTMVYADSLPDVLGSPYAKMNAEYQNGDRQKVVLAAEAYLLGNPRDGDVRLLLARCYFDQKNIKWLANKHSSY